MNIENFKEGRVFVFGKMTNVTVTEAIVHVNEMNRTRNWPTWVRNMAINNKLNEANEFVILGLYGFGDSDMV